MPDRSLEPSPPAGRVAVIGAGVSGVAAANVWKRCGYEVVVFEASSQVGGQWAQTYPGVTLQNSAPQYQFGAFPWPFEPDRHPTGEQVLRYVQAAVEHFGLDVRLSCPVASARRTEGGWELSFADGVVEAFDYLVVATGQYPGNDKKRVPPFEGIERFGGAVLTNIDTLDVFDGQRVAVIGFGKTALDFATWSAERAASTHHVFRTPRWTIPLSLLGIHYSRPFFARIGSDMMPSWGHGVLHQRLLHRHMGFVVSGFWSFIAALFRSQHRRDAKLQGVDASVLDVVLPPASQFVPDLRSASALAPPRYYEHVAHGGITAHRATVASFFEGGVELDDGSRIEADVVCVCCGNDAPTYPFFSDDIRGLLEDREGGPALYRHLVHPQIDGLGFSGYNHGFLHIALAEVGALWQVAAFQGDLELPTPDEMAASAQRVAAWKQANSSFESTCNLAVSTRFQQHLDILMGDLGLSPWRHLPNLPAELFARYDPTHYAGAVDEYLLARGKRRAKGQRQRVMELDG